jgi:hypothetical protein
MYLMKKLLLIVILLCTNTVYAQSVIWTQSSVDCGQWVNHRKTNSAIVLEHYLVGTVNGLAVGASLEIWSGTNKRSVSKEQFYLWMDNWCQNNPLKDTLEGVFDFANERTNDALKNHWKSK